jgi:hypothetical protein
VADPDQIKDLIDRAEPVTVIGLTGAIWHGTLVGYCAAPSLMIDVGGGELVTVAAELVTITEPNIYRLAALSPDELRDAIDECAAMILAAAPGRPPGNTAADMAEWWTLLNQAMSTGVPLPTPWAGDSTAADDPPVTGVTLVGDIL